MNDSAVPSGEKNPEAPGGKGNAHDYVYSRIAGAIRQDIRAGGLKPGARLPSADDLAARFEVNKGTIRRALAELTAEGLIYSVPAQGTYVAEERPVETKRHHGMLNVGVVSSVLQGDRFGPSDAEILGGLQDELARHHGSLVLIPVPRTPSPAKLAESIRRVQLDGVIYLEALEPALLRRVMQSGVPAVTINFRPRGHAVDAILIDNRGGAAQAVQHLFARGHQRLLVITGPADVPATIERTEGVREAMRARGVPAAKVNFVEGDFRRESALAIVSAALKTRFAATAIFCFNDEMAVGALQAIHKHSRLQVPRDLSVIGFDDISWAEATNPPLTTIRVDHGVMGRLAIERLMARIAGRATLGTATMLETALVIRDSTAVPPAR